VFGLVNAVLCAALLSLAGCNGTGPAPVPGPNPDAAEYSVTIQAPPPAAGIATGLQDHSGQAVTAACASCHSTKLPDTSTRRGEDLDQFHHGLQMAHGDRSCLSCHNADDYNSLRLADGTSVAFAESMQLCAQCHGPQFRDYKHGSHGGMTGYWDLTRGARTRNHCMSCHDPHAPAFPTLRPLPPPPDAVRHEENSHE
jgi:formate-dependent nitrite reductase cytochrome c552 subunit